VCACTDKINKASNKYLLLTIVMALFFSRGAYNANTAIYLIPAFILIKNGSDFWGVLSCMPIKLLGACSFSIYLLHGSMQILSKHLMTTSAYEWWGVVSIVATGIIAPLSYKYIECFFIVKRTNNALMNNGI
ncbi:TPA: hypothetical protein ND482_003297, partial [Citrobacter farmeri]|nr:hypothetical protein [Citrobacter farmeri]